jgi:putative ABC transport system permease protein
MNTLHAKPDSILVSAETVKDYQLHLGDLINLRLVDGRTHQLVTVPFHYVGVVSEFPTAPKDSFFVTNASYVTQKTGSGAVGTFLLNTGGTGSSAVAARVRALVGPTVSVTDITTTRGVVGSSLTSVDLAGLTRVELAFALVLAAAAGGLVLALGLAERRRSLAIMSALGARRRHLRATVAGETLLVGTTGALGGAVLGAYLTRTLVKVLTGVFDPPPSVITVPWPYLAGLSVLIVACLVIVTVGAVRVSRRNLLPTIRRL